MVDFTKTLPHHWPNKEIEQSEFNPNQTWAALDCGLKKGFFSSFFKKKSTVLKEKIEKGA